MHETALAVRSDSQFFAWTQGPLQALLPHEILICGKSEGEGGMLRLRYFTATRYFRPEHFEAACNSRGGLIMRVVNHWRSTRRPCLMPTPPRGAPCDPEWQAVLERLEMRNMAAHGHLAPDATVQAWFGFCRVADLGPRTGKLLELLLPAMAATYARVSWRAGAGEKRLGRLLTRREIQVLELVRDGRSNREIADCLGLSTMTAKNHVQNIRHKLKARTRGQAAMEAAQLGLLEVGGE